MRAKWRKIIWGILAVQLLLWHVLFVLDNDSLDFLVYRAVRHFGMSYFFYESWKKLVAAGWLASAALVGLFYYYHYRKFWRQCVQGLKTVTDEELKASLGRAVEETGLKISGNRTFLYCSPQAKEPFVMGCRRPILVLPKEWDYTGEVLHFILLHECCHLKSKDTLYKYFLLSMQCLMWFQPLMYLLKAAAFRDVEVACDEAVVEGRDVQARKAYGNALLECMRRQEARGGVYSAYFYHGKSLMKARISAVMRQDKKDAMAYVGIAICLIYLGICLHRITDAVYVRYQQNKEEPRVDIYAGYDLPEHFTLAALEGMVQFSPLPEDAYYREFQAGDLYEEKLYSELPYAAEGPWQVRLKSVDRYADAVSLLLQRYFYYYMDNDRAAEWDPEEQGGYMPLEAVYSRLLAGDKHEAVFGVIFRYYVGYEADDLTRFPEELKSTWSVAKEGGSYYAYYCWAAHIRMVQDYVFELEGVARMQDALEAFGNQWSDQDTQQLFSDIPQLDLVWQVDPETEVTGSRQMGGVSYSTDISTGVLQVGNEEGVMEEVPVPLEDILYRGDQMDGKLSALQEGSYQLDDKKRIFGYGGDADWVPFSVTYYDEESGSWQTTVVTRDYPGGRRIFVSFPENSQEGFFLFTGERVVWQEATILFRTWDGGKTWLEMGAAGPDIYREGHSLTTGARFVNNDVGFLTIRDSETPEVWRTEDGGVTWEKQAFPECPEYYSMAYAPEVQGKKLALYVGMEEYTEYGGIKAKYESADEGRTWEYIGYVLRK